ncbi:hypothetical protein D3C72_2196980 [compost metagenome]
MFQRGLEDPTELRVRHVPRHAPFCNEFVVDPIQQVVDHHQLITTDDTVARFIMHLDVFDIVDDSSVD